MIHIVNPLLTRGLLPRVRILAHSGIESEIDTVPTVLWQRASLNSGSTRRQIEDRRKIMIVTRIDLPEAGKRLDAGEQAYEDQTEDKTMRILGPACGFGADYLRRLRSEGLYAETL